MINVYRVPTAELLREHGECIMDSGLTFYDAWTAAKTGNEKYRIRLALIRHAYPGAL